MEDDQSIAIIDKAALVELLKHITELIETDDSITGYIGYESIEKKVIVSDDDRNDYEVKCVFRSGNKDGQGFMTFIPDINSESSMEENG